MNTVDDILTQLKGVKPAGQNQWGAFCPRHEEPPDGHTRSLGISCASDGKILLNCRGGCETKDVLATMGLTLADLFSNPPAGYSPEPKTTYEYQQENGLPYTRTVKTTPKGFYQQRHEGGEWINGLNGLKPILYRLPELLAADPAQQVFIAEGEKDSDRLASERLMATTNPGGAGKWKPGYGEYLRGRRVVILPDNDKPGRKHAQEVARYLHGVAAEVRILNLPDLQDKEDISNWLDNGGTPEKLVELAGRAPRWTPPAEPTEQSPESDPFLGTDIGNASRFVERNSGVLYCGPQGKWYCWNGVVWQQDQVEKMAEKAVATVREIYAEAAEDEAEWLMKKAKGAASAVRIRGLLGLVKHMAPVLPGQFDADPWLFNCKNCTVDLRTGKAQPHCKEDLLTKVCGTTYDARAECPKWLKFLGYIMGGPHANGDTRTTQEKTAIVRYIQRLLGLCLSGDITEQFFPILHGVGANGKSTLLDSIQGIMGPGYATTVTDTLLTVQQYNEHPTQIADLQGKRLCVATETDIGGKLKTHFIKRLTGDQRLKGRFMRQDLFEFPRTHKTLLVTNHRPVIRDTSDAIWRRVQLVPFTRQIPVGEQNKQILEDLRPEWPGILAWLVKGCLAWQQSGLDPPEEVQLFTEQYREEQSPLDEFFADKCDLGTNCIDTVCRIRKAYKEWADERKERVWSPTSFNGCLESKGCRQTKAEDPIAPPELPGAETDKDKRVRCWRRIRLKTTTKQLGAEDPVGTPSFLTSQRPEQDGDNVPF